MLGEISHSQFGSENLLDLASLMRVARRYNQLHARLTGFRGND